MREVYELRYQVYCVETGFERAEDCPGGRERDSFDAISRHALMRHRATGAPVGTVRLILPNRASPRQTLPFESICADSGARAPFSLDRAGEVSRFAVSKKFRRRALDGRYGSLHHADSGRQADSGASTEAERRLIPYMSLSMLRWILKVSREEGVDVCAMVAEPSLLRMLARFGIRFAPVGPVVEHHGLRQPGVARVSDIWRECRQRDPAIWAFLTDQGRMRPCAVASQKAA